MFPAEEMLGVDLVIPEAAYLKQRADKIEAIVLTHGHEDHIGALPFILPHLANPPVYGSAFALALVGERLKEHRLSADLRVVGPETRLSLGPFGVEFIPVAHSIPQCFGLAIETPAGLIVHSGDFKIDHDLPPTDATDLNRFAALGLRGVALMLSDSTNVEREGYTLSERLVKQTLADIFGRSQGRIMVASFASNIRRVQQVVDLAAEMGRRVAFTGRSLVTNVRIARELDLLKLPPGLEASLAEIGELAPHQVCIISTGSQGEPLSALSRVALGEHRQLEVQAGDLVILSARFIPGHERAIGQVINNLYRRGAEVVYEKVSAVHSSGHAYQEELRLLLRLVRPAHFIPLHGERRHLVRHGLLARQMGLGAKQVFCLENGEAIVLDGTGARLAGQVEAGRVFVDGKGVGDVGEMVLRDRRHISSEGVVFVLVVVDHRNGEVISGPEVISRGFVFEEEQGEILEAARQIVLEVLEKLAEPNWGVAQEEIRRALRRYFNKELDRRPVILPLVRPM